METFTKVLFTLSFVCFLVNLSRECGPGPSVSRRSKILKPMVLYQRLPDVDEESIAGSGMFRRIITESSKEYKELVKNYNKDIVFESGDGKRMMTKRCREKIDKLATLVKHEWPNVKLRVIEAYDRYGQHPPNSLHYEARAVDITTSDRDKSKIGNLGSLAFQAGFDWVSYESHSYIHASVVAEKEVGLKSADCFPGSAKIHSQKDGLIEMKNLKIGDKVLTHAYVDGQFKQVYTEVLGFLDDVIDINQPYLVIETEAGFSLETTKSHLLYVPVTSKLDKPERMQRCNDKLMNCETGSKSELLIKQQGIHHSAFASKECNAGRISLQTIFDSPNEQVIDVQPAYALSIGDEVMASRNGSIYTTRITRIRNERRNGAFAPLTEQGTIVVNNILASCYAKINNADLAHNAFMPYRFIAKILPFTTRQHLLDWYVQLLREVNDFFGFAVLR